MTWPQKSHSIICTVISTKRQNMDLISKWKQDQSHNVKTACEVGDNVLLFRKNSPVQGKYILLPGDKPAVICLFSVTGNIVYYTHWWSCVPGKDQRLLHSNQEFLHQKESHYAMPTPIWKPASVGTHHTITELLAQLSQQIPASLSLLLFSCCSAACGLLLSGLCARPPGTEACTPQLGARGTSIEPWLATQVSSEAFQQLFLVKPSLGMMSSQKNRWP